MKYIFTILLLFLSFSIHAQEKNWEFITLGKSVSSKPSWSVSRGKAQIIRDGNKITISVFYRQEINSKNGYEYYPDPQLIIEAIIKKNGEIIAKALPQSSDQSEFNLVGTYEKYTHDEEWGNVKKIVTQEEIIFPYPENIEFFGFVTQNARNKE